MRRQADTSHDLATTPTQHVNRAERGAVFKTKSVQDLVIRVDLNRGSASLENVLDLYRDALARRRVDSACHPDHVGFPHLRRICSDAGEPKFDGRLVQRGEDRLHDALAVLGQHHRLSILEIRDFNRVRTKVLTGGIPKRAQLSALRNAACQYFGSDAVEIANFQYRKAMVLPENGERIVQSILTPLNESTVEFRFTSVGADTAEMWETHMIGVARRVNAASGERIPVKIEDVLQRCGTTIQIDAYYEVLNALGLEYGTSFRAIHMLRRGRGEVVTRVRLPAHLASDGESRPHPALLDACLHLYPALVDVYGDFTQPVKEQRCTHLPLAIEHFHWTGIGLENAWVHGVRRQPINSDPDIFTVDISIFHEDGGFAGAIDGLSLKRLSPEALTGVAASDAAHISRQTAVTTA